MPSPETNMSFKLAPGLDASAALTVRPQLATIAFISTRGEYTYDWHRHEQYELIVVVRSPYMCWLNDDMLDLSRGDVLVVKPGDRHRDLLKPPVRYFALNMVLRAQRQTVIPFFSNSIQAAQQVCALPAAIRLCKRMYREGLRSDAVSGPLQSAILSELLWRLVRAFDPSCISPYLLRRSAQQELRAALERYFLQHISDTPSLEDMAAALEMGSRSLTLKCKTLLQTSPAKAFKQFKMNHAMELLQHSAMPIKEVSFYLGFRNPFHFSRVFKHYHGKAPSEFRSATYSAQ
jgi:AraC-like DNA-binding protein